MLQKTIGKQRNILRPLPQRGKYQMNGVQPVQQIFTKRTVMHHLIDRAIGGGEKTDIHRDCLVAAYTGHTTALQHCEQLSLSRRRQIAYFIHEQAAARCRLELSRTALISISKRAPFMSEKFDLK